MRRVLAVVFGVAFAAGACTGDGADPIGGATSTSAGATTTSSTPSKATTRTTQADDLKPYGGTLDYHFVPTWSLNPFLSGINEPLGPAFLGGVWSFNANTGELEPDLVVELPSMENGGLVLTGDGGMTVRYEINPDAVWSDGVPISGDDFAFTYEVVMETIARLEAAAEDDDTDEEVFEICDFRGGSISVHGAEVYPVIDPGSVAASPKSFEYTLTDPGAYSDELFRYVVPRHVVEGTDFLNDWDNRMWASAGPFVVETVDFAAHEVSMVRNDNYWRTDPETGQQLPYLDRIVVTALEDEFLEKIPTELHELARAISDCLNLDWAMEWIGIDPTSHEAQELAERMRPAVQAAEEELFFEGVVIDLAISVLDERVPELENQGVEFRTIRTNGWEHIAFNYGDARLRANNDSLVEHVEFRRAIAHALDRTRIAKEANGIPVEPIGSLVEAQSPSLSGVGWDRYDYSPDKARDLLADLCSRLARDCEADPPRMVFTTDVARPDRDRIAQLVAEMLGDVGIQVETVEQGLFLMINFEGCFGWESSTWTWNSSPDFERLAGIFTILDPAVTANPRQPDDVNFYSWGTGAVEGVEDDPETGDCDESTILNQGPSSVVDEFTRRFASLVREAESVVDLANYVPLVLEMEEILADQAVIIPLYLRPEALAWRADIVGGYGYRVIAGAIPGLWNAAEWYLVDS